MVTKDNEPEPYELVQTLRDKLQKANLSRNQIEKLVPPSLAKRNCHDIPPYQVGSYKKQREEARLRLEKLESQRLPGYVPKKLQDKYLNEFYELKAQGKLSHLSPEMLEKLEEEIKASAADAKKHAELQEFLDSLNKQSAIPEPPIVTHENASTEHNQEDQNLPKRKKSSIIKVRTNDGRLVPCFVNLNPDSLCLTALSTEKKEPKERKTPIKVSSRTVPEVVDALCLVTEYIQQHDLIKYLDMLKELETNLRQGM